MITEQTEADKFYLELHAHVKRWMNEGDKLTTFSVIGALEAVKADVMDSLVEFHENEN